MFTDFVETVVMVIFRVKLKVETDQKQLFRCEQVRVLKVQPAEMIPMLTSFLRNKSISALNINSVDLI